MSQTLIPENYHSRLSLYETQEAIGIIKRTFADALSKALNLKRVSAPLFVETASGLNDNLSGTERPVRFDIAQTNAEVEVVHSLAKWKRMALHHYGFAVGEGLYTDMNAIRRDEELDNLHSVYVDQWDWEKIITKEMRTLATLKDAMQRIVTAICITNDMLKWKYPALDTCLVREAAFATSQELEDRWPHKTPKERETAFVEEAGSACILQIGGKLKSGIPHDGRAPDYDDWELNGDIFFWDSTLNIAMELSSMGIRVSPESLSTQLTLSGCDDRRHLPFHRSVLSGSLPFTIGGGIGQSRMCMLLLQKAHIGEVQSSFWDDITRAHCLANAITLL